MRGSQKVDRNPEGLEPEEGFEAVTYPMDREAWGRLCRLLTLGKSRADAQKGEKGRCFLHWDDLAGAAQGAPGLANRLSGHMSH